MAEYVHPDYIFKIDIDGGSLKLSKSYDVIHRFQKLDFHLLKYWQSEKKPNGICDIALHAEAAGFLMRECGLYLIDREEMGTHEHECYVRWSESQLNEAAMGLDDEI